MVQRGMPSYVVETPQRTYHAMVERGVLSQVGECIPAKAGKIFVVSTQDVWDLHGPSLSHGLRPRQFELLLFPGGEPRKRLAEVENLAEQMAAKGGDRSSIVVAFGGGILTDVAGFLAAIFMRGVPLIQIPTTLLAQVDAGVGGKTGVNLTAGKNLVGSFHQPLAVLIDPAVLDTLPEREYRAGLFEIIKHGVIADVELFRLLRDEKDKVLRQAPDTVTQMVSESIRIKAAVVSADEREGDLRRILNFGHTFGHALEAETGYTRFLHGEAVGWGMLVATRLARKAEILWPEDETEILNCLHAYKAPDKLSGVSVDRIAARLAGDKKTIQGRVHFVLPDVIGHVRITSDIDEALVRWSIEESLHA
jgi:3-dehydroquinate synthase